MAGLDAAHWPHLAPSLAELGRSGSRHRVATPALILDVDALDRNIARMAERAKRAGLKLRPHAKSHKSAFIARRQVAAGAVGVCCAKLGEAEALAQEGIDGILITSPVAGAAAARRAAALSKKLVDFAVVVDHPDGVRALQEAAAEAEALIDVVIDIDVGLHRTGVADLQGAVALAQQIGASKPLTLVGLQGYGGSWQHMKGRQARHAAVEHGTAILATAAKSLKAQGAAIAQITGGGTGTFAADAALGILNEVQPGSYVFMDAQYRDALGDDADGAFEQSLFVQASVISANQPGFVTVDAGLKAFATDAGPPRPATAPFAAGGYSFFGDEHGRILRPEGHTVAIGDRIELVPPHCDPNVDRFDVYHVVSGDRLIDIVPIEARGRSQ
jgi:D-serine deaminase-like pyridoxal phosphate-dependent protein